MDLQFTPEERAHLRSYRRAAEQVRNASIIDEGQTVSIGASVDDAGRVRQTHELLENERFRSLAMSIRLVYMQGEPANHGHICNILRTRLPTANQAQVDVLRQ